MHLTTLLTALCLGLSIAAPTSNSGYVRHEKRTNSGQLVRRSRAPPATKVPVRIGLKQSNLDLGHERLMEISDPNSDKYGQHMSAKEVGEFFRPSDESIESVREWIHSSGIDNERHQVSPGRGWLKFEATVEELESLLSTEYHLYYHAGTEEEHIGCDAYHVPHEIHPHIDFISPTVSTIQIKSRDTKHKGRSATKSFSRAALPPYVRPAGISLHTKADIEIPCYTAITPDCIRQFYSIPLGTSNQTGNEIGIFEDGDFYNQEDLDLTFGALAPYVPNGTHPILEGIDGGTAPLSIEGVLQIGVESLLDMSIIFPLIHPQQAILFQVDDQKEVETTEGFGDTFLDALDASYCTFEGGDDPTLDPIYPDTAPNPANETFLPNGTWGEPEMCGFYKPTNVISVSYGLAENTYSYLYENRQCQEYMKLGLQGVTVIYASGDSGVSSGGICIFDDSVNITVVRENPGAFSPGFPASCPYVTAVGATQINDDETETAVAVPSQGFFSGGGFSNYWPAPSYQESTLANYFANTPPPYDNLTIYGTPYYNKTGRGFPDMAAVGLNVLLYISGQPAFVGGTSASAPVVASIINLINEERLAAGKSTVGFINPTIYQNPDAFTDITTGSNPGCGTEGFSAVAGWDPVTGLGTPIFDKLLAVFMALP